VTATPPPIKPPEQIPPSLEIARHVTEEEFTKAKRQFTILWAGTTAAPILAALALGALGFIAIFGWIGLAALVAIGIVTYIVLFAMLPEARKMSTMRLRRYKELKAWRAAKERFEAGKEHRNDEAGS
jgi:hypothetical protein